MQQAIGWGLTVIAMARGLLPVKSQTSPEGVPHNKHGMLRQRPMLGQSRSNSGHTLRPLLLINQHVPSKHETFTKCRYNVG